MQRIHCFAPIEDADAVVLVLGSMPGKASLAAGQYYAHQRNIFWTIMGDLVGAHPGLPYEERLKILRSSGIALWDVLQSCVRKTSLDSHIEITSEAPERFQSFLPATSRHHARVLQWSQSRAVLPETCPPFAQIGTAAIPTPAIHQPGQCRIILSAETARLAVRYKKHPAIMPIKTRQEGGQDFRYVLERREPPKIQSSPKCSTRGRRSATGESSPCGIVSKARKWGKQASRLAAGRK